MFAACAGFVAAFLWSVDNPIRGSSNDTWLLTSSLLLNFHTLLTTLSAAANTYCCSPSGSQDCLFITLCVCVYKMPVEGDTVNLLAH